MSEKITCYIDEERIDKRIRELGSMITEDFKGEELYIICILKGAVYFATELTKRIDLPIRLDFMSASSYGNDTKSSGVVRITRDIEESIKGKNVLIVEDIIDTGRTLKYLIELLGDREPKSIKLCSLLDKPDRRVVEIQGDYVGFEVPDEFVVGYGLDYAQKYRSLPYVGILSFEEDK